MRSSFARLTITRLRYPMHTDGGVTRPDYAAEPTETPIGGCWYEPITSTIDRDGRTAVRTGYNVDAPPRIDLTEFDHVRIDGAEHELDGRPLAVPSPSGALDSTKFTSYRWEG